MNVVGSAPALGSWEAQAGASLQWHEGNTWKGSVEIESDTSVEFKLVRVAGEESLGWEDGPNRIISVQGPSVVVCNWAGETVIKPNEAASQGKKLRSAAGAAKKKADSLKNKTENLEAKVNGLEKKVAKSSTKLKSIQDSQAHDVMADHATPAFETVLPTVAVAVDEADPPHAEHAEPELAHAAPVVIPEAVHVPEPVKINGNHISNGSTAVELSTELTSLVESVSLSSDGGMMIEFGDEVNGMSAAELAAKLLSK